MKNTYGQVTGIFHLHYLSGRTLANVLYTQMFNVVSHHPVITGMCVWNGSDTTVI
jgi:hypothetical protein